MSHENGKNGEKNIEELKEDNGEHIVSGRNETLNHQKIHVTKAK